MNIVSAVPTQKDDQLHRLTVLLSGVIDKLERNVEASAPRRSLSGFSDAHDISSLEEEEELDLSVSDPLDA